MRMGLGVLPVGRFDIPERFDAWEERGMQRWIIQGWDSGGGKTSHTTENGGGWQGLSAGGVQDGNMFYDHDEARESG